MKNSVNNFFVTFMGHQGSQFSNLIVPFQTPFCLYF